MSFRSGWTLLAFTDRKPRTDGGGIVGAISALHRSDLATYTVSTDIQFTGGQVLSDLDEEGHRV